ncbi:hypothetical protein TKK_0019420 [Trichogramma kaykai]
MYEKPESFKLPLNQSIAESSNNLNKPVGDSLIPLEEVLRILSPENTQDAEGEIENATPLASSIAEIQNNEGEPAGKRAKRAIVPIESKNAVRRKLTFNDCKLKGKTNKIDKQPLDCFNDMEEEEKKRGGAEKKKLLRPNELMQNATLMGLKQALPCVELKDSTTKKIEKLPDTTEIDTTTADIITPEPISPKKPDNFDSFIIESIPSKFRNNGKNLLKWLRQHSDISWSDKGVVTIDDAVIAGNMLDHVNAIMRQRKGTPPADITQFAAALRRASVPAEFIGNKHYKRYITDNTDTEEEEGETPTNSISPKKGSKRKRRRGDLTLAETEFETPYLPEAIISTDNRKKWKKLQLNISN